MTTIGIGIVGTGKMGRAHSQAWATVPRFFDLETRPALRAACGRDAAKTGDFASRFGWESVETDWRHMVRRDDVDLVDICTSNDMHAEIALEATRHGKHVVCEKPLALDAPTAARMADAAEAAGVRNMVVFNYRFVPAVRLARQLIEAGELGEIHQFVGSFQQDWLADPNAPMTWRLREATAGSGVLGDLGAHIVDLARYLVGEISSVTGSLHTVVPHRRNERGEMEAVTVDDAFESLIQFESGASGVLQASRVATGQKTRNRFEIYGSKGGLRFDFQSMNELEFLSTSDPAVVRGYRTISTTLPGAHPYADRWWGTGHLIGFEHTFTHLAHEMLSSIDEQRQPTPSFRDGEACQVVLDAIAQSHDLQTRVTIGGSSTR